MLKEYVAGFCFIDCLLLCVLALICGGCVTRQPAGTITDPTVLEHQREIAELEARNAELAERFDRYNSAVERSVEQLNDIANRAGQMGNSVDEIIELYNEYQRTIERLIADYNRLQNEAGSSE